MLMLVYQVPATSADDQLQQPLKQRKDAVLSPRAATAARSHLMVDSVAVLRYQGCGGCGRAPDVAKVTVRLVTATARSKYCRGALTIRSTVKHDDNQQKSDEMIWQNILRSIGLDVGHAKLLTRRNCFCVVDGLLSVHYSVLPRCSV